MTASMCSSLAAWFFKMTFRQCGLRRARTLLFAVFSVGLGFIFMVNVMVSHLSPTSDPQDATFPNYRAEKHPLRQLMQPGKGPVASQGRHAAQVTWVDRKPKAAKERGVQYRLSGPRHTAKKNLSSLANAGGKNGPVEKHLEVYDDDDKDYKDEDIDKLVIKDDDSEEDGEDNDENDDINHDDDDYYGPDGEELQANHGPRLLPPLHKHTAVLHQGKDYAFHYADLTNVTIPVERMVQDGIYWSDEVEDIIPTGLHRDEVWRWVDEVRGSGVRSLVAPSWNRCGRPKNGFLEMEGGQALCARYRHPHDNLVLGELLSFHLSRMLGLDSVPAVLLSRVNSSAPAWRHSHPHSLGWDEGQFVALIQWIPGMETARSHVRMPELLLTAYENKTVLDKHSLPSNLTASSLSTLVQWGSMLVFDYLTGNYDRVASMQDAADKESRPSIMRENIRNLRQAIPSHKLWLIDNESGLLDAYDLMYGTASGGPRFVNFHRQTLQTLCLFQRPLVAAIAGLHASPSPHRALEDFARERDPLFQPLFQRLSATDKAYPLFQTRFAKRLAEVYGWIQFCQSRVR